jgi:hypothetical protein
VNNEMHTFVVDNQDHPQMIEIHAELQRLSGPLHDVGHVCKRLNLLWLMKTCFICVTSSVKQATACRCCDFHTCTKFISIFFEKAIIFITLMMMSILGSTIGDALFK